ncbi:MAG: SDR family oxidoreductase [Myxococcales bacterium]|nr:SDR family oxidoreductase [Myxococcales bacterium]
MTTKKSVVITGSSRGIGLGLATEFLRAGCNVAICGRSQAKVDEALQKLKGIGLSGQVIGQSCDVSDIQQVQALWDASVKAFGNVDIWLNNAGQGTVRSAFWDVSPEEIHSVVQANVLGMMYGSHVAMRGMIAQGGGTLYNMEGLGSNGTVLAGAALYSSTKAGLTHFTATLIKDAQETPVKVCYLSPGIVITDLFTGGAVEKMDPPTRRIANILGDHVEVVTPYLVRRILANQKHGARINWLTQSKIMARFFLALFRKRDLFSQPPT